MDLGRLSFSSSRFVGGAAALASPLLPGPFGYLGPLLAARSPSLDSVISIGGDACTGTGPPCPWRPVRMRPSLDLHVNTALDLTELSFSPLSHSEVRGPPRYICLNPISSLYMWAAH